MEESIVENNFHISSIQFQLTLTDNWYLKTSIRRVTSILWWSEFIWNNVKSSTRSFFYASNYIRIDVDGGRSMWNECCNNAEEKFRQKLSKRRMKKNERNGIDLRNFFFLWSAVRLVGLWTTILCSRFLFIPGLGNVWRYPYMGKEQIVTKSLFHSIDI